MGIEKNIKFISALLITLLIILSIVGCSGGNSSEKFGIDITEKKVVEVKDVFTSPTNYLTLIFSNKSIDSKKISALLEEINLKDKEKIQVRHLSGGDKQRTGIARALVNEPKVIIADEPTGKLETKVRPQIFKLFKRLSEKGVAVFIATHDLELAQATQRIIHLQDGKIITKEKSDLYY